MTIIINREENKGECLDGIMMIDGEKVCDTSENFLTCIVPGIYDIERRRCKQMEQERFVPVIKVFDEMYPCEKCRKLEYAGYDTPLPCYCPQIKVGSGIHERLDGRIIVGKRVAPGIVEHSLEAFELLSERIRKCIARGKKVNIIIKDIEQQNTTL